MADLTTDLMKQQADLAGFNWTTSELEALRGVVSRALDALARLEQLPLRDVEPTTQYRVL